MAISPSNDPRPLDEMNSLDATIGRYEIRMPSEAGLMSQDQEWCELTLEGETSTIRFHDYDLIYHHPGLYESLFYRMLKCTSPKQVVRLLETVFEQDDQADLSGLRVLDLGAGNGMVGEQLIDAGADAVVGLDIIPEAKAAVERDRPWVYDDYHIVDLLNLPEAKEKKIREARLNCLTTVAALGFGDVPSGAFLKSLDLIESPGWVVFNLNENFLAPDDESGFAALIQELSARKVLRVDAWLRYQHRLSTTGEPLFYLAMIAHKLDDVPVEMLEELLG
ncbi:MAG: class I SAM-dependent methyltransferase [Phycisphaeraceae bacterium]